MPKVVNREVCFVENFFTQSNIEWASEQFEKQKFYFMENNLSVNKEKSRYHAGGDVLNSRYNFPDKLPAVNGLIPRMVAFNKYEDGDFILPHVDKNEFLMTVVVPMQNSKNNGTTIYNPEKVEYNDVFNRAIIFNANKIKHEVRTVHGERKSVIIFY